MAAVDISKDKKYYPDRMEFMKALQEEPTVDPKSPDGALHYPDMLKIASKVFNLLKDEKFPNLHSNKSRTSREIAHAWVRLRKQLDKTAVHDEFQCFAHGGNSKLYIIQNDLQYFGFDVFLRNYSNHLASKVVQKQDDRTPSDAIRVAAVMLATENRKAVAGILSGNKDRAKSDQPVDPTKAWGMLAVEQFRDPDFIVPRPNNRMDPTDVDGIDPNDVSRMCLHRDCQWFLDTWKYYLKKKYKAGIRKWDKETGGGSHEPHEFANFCDGSRWLVWVYLMDMENDFLLYSNAQGKPPSFVGHEAGFDAVISEVTVDDDDDGVEQEAEGQDSRCVLTPRTPAAKGTAAREAATDLKKRGRAAADFVEQLRKDYSERQREKREQLEELKRERHDRAERKRLKQQGVPTTPAEVIMDQIIATHEKKEKLEKAAACMTPNSRRQVLGGITKKIQRLGTEYKEMTTRSSGGDSEDSNGEE
jgi:hypothetical protein